MNGRSTGGGNRRRGWPNVLDKNRTFFPAKQKIRGYLIQRGYIAQGMQIRFCPTGFVVGITGTGYGSMSMVFEDGTTYLCALKVSTPN